MLKNRLNDTERRIHREEHVKAIKEKLHSQEVKKQVRDNEQIETALSHQSKEHERISCLN